MLKLLHSERAGKKREDKQERGQVVMQRGVLLISAVRKAFAF